jgi:hypothetical protein
MTEPAPPKEKKLGIVTINQVRKAYGERQPSITCCGGARVAWTLAMPHEFTFI